MLAQWCERESAEEAVLTLGKTAADWWEEALPGQVIRNGTLVVAAGRDTGELTRFAGRTSGCDWLDGAGIEALEPALGGRFKKALFFREEAHLDPRKALAGLHRCARTRRFHFGQSRRTGSFDRIIDCTGAAAIGQTADLRGVRGEMLFLETSEISLSRPVRLLHPRIPLYIAPRGDNRFMVGATMIESDDAGPISARSLMELLNAAYALHPAFGEARLVETGVGVRPAYPDNLPRVTFDGDVISVNGFYRHGFRWRGPWLRGTSPTPSPTAKGIAHDLHRQWRRTGRSGKDPRRSAGRSGIRGRMAGDRRQWRTGAPRRPQRLCTQTPRPDRDPVADAGS
jgi:glycine oxidase